MSKSTFEFVQPKNWASPKGYANGVVAQGRQVFIAGQVGWNAQAQFESDDFVAQVEQALKNIVDVLAAAGGEPRHLVRLNWYVTDKAEYAARQTRDWRSVSPDGRPAFSGDDIIGCRRPARTKGQG